MHYLLILGLFLLLGSAKASDPGNSAGDEAIIGAISPVPSPAPPVTPGKTTTEKTDWNGLLRSSAHFLAIQHGFRFLTEPGTRSGMRGPFVPDYVASVSRMRRWGDNDPFIVNYVGHPLMGAEAGFLYLQHTGSTADLQFGKSGAYWKSRLRAMAYSAAYSTQFELGPISEASLGNVGYDYKTMGMVDIVVTPLAGTGWLVAEDVIDRFLIQEIEQWTGSQIVRIPVRCLLNPSRAFGNLMRGKLPWIRTRDLPTGQIQR